VTRPQGTVLASACSNLERRLAVRRKDVTWEVELFKKTRLGAYKNCLDLIDAYARFAPLWERVLLATFAGLGPPLGRWFGGNTKTLWEQADVMVADVLAASGMTPHEIARALRHYVRLKRREDHPLSFEKAREATGNCF
jgi:hypothetical protein